MIFIVLFLLFGIVHSKLSYVATVFRHGARYPLSDLFDGNVTHQFHGKLTSVGMRQLFLLGGYYKAQYINKAGLINQTLFPKQIQVFTDSSERCVESAISHLVGMFPFATGERLPQSIDPKYLNPPFETHLTRNLRQLKQSANLADFALRLGFQPVSFINASRFFPNCPNEAKLIAKRIEAEIVKFTEFQMINAAFTQKMRLIFKLPPEYANLFGLAELYDVIICDYNLGRQTPVQFTEYDYRQLKYVQNYLFALLYGGDMSKIFSTSVVIGILGNMENIIKNGQKQVKRFSIYSGHDTNVVPLLNFFNLTSPQCITKQWKNQTVTGNCAEVPPFASNLIFELHTNDTDPKRHYVKLRYNGDYYDLCQKSLKQCDYTQFANRTRAQFADVVKQCGITSTEDEQQINVLIE